MRRHPSRLLLRLPSRQELQRWEQRIGWLVVAWIGLGIVVLGVLAMGMR